MRLLFRNALLCFVLAVAAFPALAQSEGMLSADGGKAMVAAPAATGTATAPVPGPAQDFGKPAASSSSPLSPDNPAYALPGPATPQDLKAADDEDPLKNPIFRSLSVQMQQQIMNEAQTFFRDCSVKGQYATFHNCECLSLHYMNQRIRDPDKTQQEIQENIMLDCVDKPSIAGFGYKRCVNVYSSMFPTILKPLCECYAREMAKRYAAKPNVNQLYISNMGSDITQSCRAKLTSMTPDAQAGTP